MYPGAPTPYPRNDQSAKPNGEVSIDAIGRAWNIVTQNLGPYSVCCLLSALPVLISYAIGFAIMIPLFETESGWLILGGLGLFTLLAIAGVTIGSVIAAGMVTMTLKALRGEVPEFSDISTGFQNNPFGIMAVTFIFTFAVNTGFNACYIPGFLIGGVWLICIPLMLEKNLGPIAALKESYRWMQEHYVMAAVVYLLASLVAGLGGLACGIGLLVTMPVYFATTAVIYEDLRTSQVPFGGHEVQPEGPLGIYGSQAPSSPTDPFVGYSSAPPLEPAAPPSKESE